MTSRSATPLHRTSHHWRHFQWNRLNFQTLSQSVITLSSICFVLQLCIQFMYQREHECSKASELVEEPRVKAQVVLKDPNVQLTSDQLVFHEAILALYPNAWRILVSIMLISENNIQKSSSGFLKTGPLTECLMTETCLKDGSFPDPFEILWLAIAIMSPCLSWNRHSSRGIANSQFSFFHVSLKTRKSRLCHLWSLCVVSLPSHKPFRILILHLRKTTWHCIGR